MSRATAADERQISYECRWGVSKLLNHLEVAGDELMESSDYLNGTILLTRDSTDERL
jgi:hypothetical protein